MIVFAIPSACSAVPSFWKLLVRPFFVALTSSISDVVGIAVEPVALGNGIQACGDDRIPDVVPKRY